MLTSQSEIKMYPQMGYRDIRIWVLYVRIWNLLDIEAFK
jgi:hypothetical protein